MAETQKKSGGLSHGKSGVSMCDSTTFGDMLQMRLLRTEAKYRSHFLYDQIEAFEDKVYKSHEQFNVDLMHTMFVELTKRTVIDVRKVKTIANLRKCLVNLKTMIRNRFRHRGKKILPEEERIVDYFTWFFKFLEYLKELRNNFVHRIFAPLFKYFYRVGYDGPARENSTDSSELFRSSAMSFRSLDSGYSGLSRLTTLLAEGENLQHSAHSIIEETKEARRKIITKNALIALSMEFRDIKHLYDTTDIEKLALRLSHLKDRTDCLLDSEDTITYELLSQDSERTVFHLKEREFGSELILRHIPDILLKFQKATWLARRWLEKDDETTKDLNEKLEKLTALEEEMNKRLAALSTEIHKNELELESQFESLSNLLKREERSSNLRQNVLDLTMRKETLQEKLTVLNSEREELCKTLTAAAKHVDRKTYMTFKPIYEKNKIKRFAIERKIAALNFHISLAESDMNIELEVKTDVIYTTNDVQDKCEEIEKTLEKARQEQTAIQAALMPISQDKEHVNEQIQLLNGQPVSNTKPVLRAEFIGTRYKTSEKTIDRNPDFQRRPSLGNPVSVFITSLTDDGHVKSLGKPIKTVDKIQSRVYKQYAPGVMTSEW